jgi:Domain of unknown function (DUF1707)
VTAGREDGTTGAVGQLRTSRADRERAIDVLKAAFVQGRLTKDEFDLRVGQVVGSRTYADLDALTADIPEGVISAQPSAEHPREPAVASVLLVGLTGLFVAGLLAALLMLLSWVVRRSRRGAAQGPPSGPAGLASRRRAPARQLPPERSDPWQMAEAARSRPPRPFGRRLVMAR